MYKVKLRGEICVGFGSLLSLAAFILLIFVHVGTTNLTSTPRRIALATMNVTDYGAALAVGFSPDPIQGLYATNGTLPLASGRGIRDVYQWGLYGYCAFLLPTSPNDTTPNITTGACSNMTAAARFTPYDAFVADMATNYTVFTNSIINGVSFRDSALLGGHTHAAYFCIIIGTVLCFLSLILGLIKHTWSFLLSALLGSVASILVLTGAALWAATISAARSANSLVLAGSNTPLGIVIESALGLKLLWAAFGCMTAALAPYWISACTFRG